LHRKVRKERKEKQESGKEFLPKKRFCHLFCVLCVHERPKGAGGSRFCSRHFREVIGVNSSLFQAILTANMLDLSGLMEYFQKTFSLEPTHVPTQLG
jgi:hypothetical protein